MPLACALRFKLHDFIHLPYPLLPGKNYWYELPVLIVLLIIFGIWVVHVLQSELACGKLLVDSEGCSLLHVRSSHSTGKRVSFRTQPSQALSNDFEPLLFNGIQLAPCVRDKEATVSILFCFFFHACWAFLAFYPSALVWKRRWMITQFCMVLGDVMNVLS